MIRPLLAALFLATLMLSPLWAGEVIELNRRDGGSVLQAGEEARSWKRNRDTIIIKHWQISSSALAVLEAHRIGVRVCYARKGDPMLWLHQTKINGGKKWIFRDEAKIRFGISSPINGYRKLHPREVGIPACPASLVATRRVLPKAEVWQIRPKKYPNRLFLR